MTDDAIAKQRLRLSMLVGMLGSVHPGERANAHDAIGKALKGLGRTWSWISELVARGELPQNETVAGRERLLRKFVSDALAECTRARWSLNAFEAQRLDRLLHAIEDGGDHMLSDADIEVAYELAAAVRQRTRP